MSERDALFQAVLDDPEADAPRLVFADWLLENGDSDRADFIRAQIDAERLPPDDPRRDAALHRQRSLLAKHGSRWKKELPAWPGVKWGPLERGFVSSVDFGSISAFRLRADSVGRVAPVARVRFLRQPTPRVRDLLRSPLLGRFRALELSGGVAGAADDFAASPHVAALVGLARSRARNSGSVLGEPLPHLVIGPVPLERVGVEAVVLRG